MGGNERMDLIENIEKRHYWITYKGKDIQYNDYSGLVGEQFPALIAAMTERTLNEGKVGNLVLIDFRDSYVNKDAVKAFGEAGKKVNDITIKTALVGISGVKKVLLNFINKVTSLEAKAFNTIEEAKEYLIS